MSIKEAIVSLIERIRPTALLFGGAAFVGMLLIMDSTMSEAAKLTLMPILAVVFGAGVAKSFDDPPPPVVPATVAMKMLEVLENKGEA